MAKSKASNKGQEEVQTSKSPAEFFAENQAIAGFDNLGKSLYTSIRELVENSLDACESVNILPDILLKIEEMDQKQFNKIRGVSNGKDGLVDEGLFLKKGSSSSSAVPVTQNENNEKPNKKKSRNEDAYFRISVRDNGCGMVHSAIPNLLGRVLSGSKYGVRQTRGKYGLGGKMCLIWSKKSTGMPINIKTSHVKSTGSISTCILDINIYKNEPKVIEHKKRNNSENWKGTEIEILIAGAWSSYKSRIVQYLQQLAIITPYAKIEMQYSKMNDSKKDMTIRYDRRSEQMPPPAREVKHHPSSVNNLLIQQLLDKSTSKTLLRFFCDDLSGVTPSIAKRVIKELGNGYKESMLPSKLNGKQITRLVQLLRSVELFRPPDGSCLSPLGEYNLNLGIRKVIEPEIVATARDRPSAYEGHPFIVEAAISLGGKTAKEGINVIRFANRIPLLFEAGADVSTRVAQSKIKWSAYKIDHKKDKIGCFVSIVSTKIPFKGTGKEYIGDDITEIQASVKRALQSCCQQLRSQLVKRNALRDANQRKSRLIKYVPDATRSIFALLEGMKKRRLEEQADEDEDGEPIESSPRKIPRSKATDQRIDRECNNIIKQLDDGTISEKTIQASLVEAIEAQGTNIEGAVASWGEDKNKGGASSDLDNAQPVFLVPVKDLKDPSFDIQHPLFTFRPMHPLITKKE